MTKIKAHSPALEIQRQVGLFKRKVFHSNVVEPPSASSTSAWLRSERLASPSFEVGSSSKSHRIGRQEVDVLYIRYQVGPILVLQPRTPSRERPVRKLLPVVTYLTKRSESDPASTMTRYVAHENIRRVP
jgi:hypothetical protein